MKKKIIISISTLIVVFTISISFLYWNYKKEIGNIFIVQEFQGGDDFYKYTYLRIILPEELYHHEKTLNAIKFYIEFERKRGKQNLWFRVVLYENWDSFSECKEYKDVYIE